MSQNYAGQAIVAFISNKQHTLCLVLPLKVPSHPGRPSVNHPSSDMHLKSAAGVQMQMQLWNDKHLQLSITYSLQHGTAM